MDMIIESPAFTHNHPIPDRYTCQGEDISPPLKFTGLPKATITLALIVDDPDAPRGTFDHWIVWNIPKETVRLDEGSWLPLQGTNGFGSIGYRGPCPPPGKPHRYYFKLYALDTALDLSQGSSKSEVESAMKGHILGQATIIGTYQRQGE